MTLSALRWGTIAMGIISRASHAMRSALGFGRADGEGTAPEQAAKKQPVRAVTAKGAITHTDGPDRLLEKLRAIAERPAENLERGIAVLDRGRIVLSQGALAKMMWTSKSNTNRWLSALVQRGDILIATSRNGTEISIVSSRPAELQFIDPDR